nr:ribonuclease H-like domain-containing protein [Tanacetum cinerariifolium]
GILGRRPTGKPVNPNRPKPVSAGQQNLVFASPRNPISAEQQNTVSAGQPNPDSAGQPNPVSAGEATLACNSIPLSDPAGDGILGPRPLNIQHKSWPWTKYGMSKIKGSKINGGSKSKSWSYAKGPLGRPNLEKEKDRGIVDSGCSRSMSGNKDKLEDFEDFDGGENLYTFSLNELAPKGPLTCLIAKALQNESTLWHRIFSHVNFKNMNKLVKGNLVRGPPSKFNHKVKAIRCDNGTEFKNANLIEFCRVLVTKPHDKTPYELLTRDKPSISYLKPFGCHVTILNTSDPLGKFDKKSYEGYIVGYSISSKAYRVYNLVSRKIEETMNLKFLEKKPFVAGTCQAWMFDIDYLTNSLNYSRVSSTNLTASSQGATPSNAGSQEDDSDSDDETDVLIIQSTPTLVVPIVDEATTQN